MSRLCANADGNFSASIWGLCSSTAELDSETGSTLLTASDQSSATFTPAATAIDAILLKLASRATGSPTNTITVTLRNNTSATDITSVTINVSDLPVCDTSDRQGGWICFKLGSTHTPNGTDTYLIKAKLSATTTAVALWRDGTVANWSRQLRLTTTQAPAANDRMIIAKEWTAAATGTARAITYDITATTNWGVNSGLSTNALNSGGAVNAALCVCQGSTLTWGNTAATNYYMKCTGPVMIYSGGTWVRGTSVSPIPSDGSAVLEFAEAVSSDSGLGITTGCTFTDEGSPRTAGKNIVWCLLNADAAASATTLNVDTDTGWKSGDNIVIASTTQTQSQAETKLLNADAGASSMVITVALSNAHGGSASSYVQAEVINLTRNVVIRSDNSSRAVKILIGNATFSQRWVQYKYVNTVVLGTTSAAAVVEYCSVESGTIAGGGPFGSSGTSILFTFRHNVSYIVANTQVPTMTGLTHLNFICTDFVSICTNGGGVSITTSQTGMGEVHDIRSTGPLNFTTGSPTQSVGSDFGNIVQHSASSGLVLNVLFNNRTISGIKVWRNAFNGMTIGVTGTITAHDNAILQDLIAFGNNSRNVIIDPSTSGEITFSNPTIAGDTSFTTTTGIYIQETSTLSWVTVKVLGGQFGVASGTRTTHSTTDIQIGGNSIYGKRLWANLINTTLASATEISLGTALKQGDGYSWQRPDGALAGSRTFIAQKGTVTYETSTVQASTASQKLTPACANSATLYSGRKRVAVDSGVTVTMSVYARKDGSYNGTIEPRLVVLANPAVGINSDTVLDTLSVGANTWEQLSGTTGTTTDKGVLEFVVECNGTAGNAFCDTWAAS